MSLTFGQLPSLGALSRLAEGSIAILRRSPFFPDPPRNRLPEPLIQ